MRHRWTMLALAMLLVAGLAASAAAQDTSPYLVSDWYTDTYELDEYVSWFVVNPTPVRLAVYDVQGRLMETLMDGVLPAGTHRIRWNGAGFASGIYFLSAQSKAFAAARKIILLK